jgi:hypothetical protein
MSAIILEYWKRYSFQMRQIIYIIDQKIRYEGEYQAE